MAATGIASADPASSLMAIPGPPGRTTAAQTAAPPILAVTRVPASARSAVSNFRLPAMRWGCAAIASSQRWNAGSAAGGGESAGDGREWGSIGGQPAAVDAMRAVGEVETEHLLERAGDGALAGMGGVLVTVERPAHHGAGGEHRRMLPGAVVVDRLRYAARGKQPSRGLLVVRELRPATQCALADPGPLQEPAHGGEMLVLALV